VEIRLGAGVAELDKSGVTLSNGERIECATVIWAAGMRAAPLTAQIPAERDNFGRLLVDRDLRVMSDLAYSRPATQPGQRATRSATTR
jgi:NADH dehydrogenase